MGGLILDIDSQFAAFEYIDNQFVNFECMQSFFCLFNDQLCRCHSIPDLSFGEKTVEASFFAATASDNAYFDDSATVAGENGCGCACTSGGCKCGDNCTCDPCNCK